MVRIKICGVTTPDDARLAAEAGADAIGLNFYKPSPRFITPDRAAAIIRALPAFTVPIGVFVGMPLRQACAVAFQLGLRGIQTYEQSDPIEDVFPFAHIPAFRVSTREDLDCASQCIDRLTAAGRAPAAVLVDSRVEGQLGGTGHAAPWKLLASFNPGIPVILAGGLTPENVAEAIGIVKPWAVDVASGVESQPGRKDPAKVARFVKIIRETTSRNDSH
jgi:phosphoribosylanthranilate isomerase